MSRRLPVYLLIDTSGSMSGQPIEAVRSGLGLLERTLRQDPYALETAYISVITFDSHANQIVPLTDLESFQMPHIQEAGLTAMGSALKLLVDCINKEVHQGSADKKGDWRPIVFLLTDGLPTDNLKMGLDALKTIKLANLVVCGAGSGIDQNTLKSIAETQGDKGTVVTLDTADAQTLGAFFKWVTDSIKTTSVKIDLKKSQDGGKNDLPPPPPELNITL